MKQPSRSFLLCPLPEEQRGVGWGGALFVWPSKSLRCYTLQVIPVVQDTALQNRPISLSIRSPRCADCLHLGVQTASWKHQKARPPCHGLGQLKIQASTNNRLSKRISASLCFLGCQNDRNQLFLIKKAFHLLQYMSK